MGRVANQNLGADISTTGTKVRLDTSDKSLVGIQINGDADASYAVDVSEDGDNWYEEVATYATTQSVSDSLDRAERFVRVRVTTAAGAGDTADILISAAR